MREVDSEKSPIVTLSAVCGARGLIENVLTRTAFAELVGGTSVICRKAQSSPGIAVRAAGVHRSDAGGCVTRPEPSAGGGSRRVRVAGHYRLREWTAAHQG